MYKIKVTPKQIDLITFIINKYEDKCDMTGLSHFYYYDKNTAKENGCYLEHRSWNFIDNYCYLETPIILKKIRYYIKIDKELQSYFSNAMINNVLKNLKEVA